MLKFIIGIFFLFISFDLHSQDKASEIKTLCKNIPVDREKACLECQDYLKAGLNFHQKTSYVNAITSYSSAYDAKYLEAKTLIQELISVSANELEKLKNDAENNNVLLEQQKKDIEREKNKVQEESNNRKKAEDLAKKNAKEARFFGKRAESLRMPILADSLLLKNNHEDALKVAFHGLLLADGQKSHPSWKTFNEAIKRNKTISPTITINDNITLLKSIAGNKYLMQTKQNTSIWGVNEFKQIQLFKKFGDLMCFDNKAFLINDNTIQELNFETYELQTLISNSNSNPSKIVSCSPGNAFLAVKTKSNQNIVYDLNKKTELIILPEENIYQLTFNNQDSHFLTRTANPKLKLYSTSTQNFIPIGLNEIYIYHAAFSNIGNQLATVNILGEVKIWDLEGKNIYSFTLSTIAEEGIQEISFYDNDKKLLIHTTKDVYLYNLNEKKIICTIQHQEPITNIQLLSEKNAILLCLESGLFFMYDFNGKENTRFKGHNGSILNVDFASNYQLFLSTSTDDTSILWDIAGTSLLKWDLGVDNPIPAVFNHDETTLLIPLEKNTKIQKFPNPYIQYERLCMKKSGILRELSNNVKYQLFFVQDEDN